MKLIKGALEDFNFVFCNWIELSNQAVELLKEY